MFGSFDQIHMEASNVLGQDDLVAAKFRVTAVNTKPIPMPDGTTLPATGRSVDLVMAAIMRVNVDGEIVEAHRFQDNLAFLRALGVV